MSLLVVGSVAFDGIETPHGKVDRTLGGAASYFALAASHFAPVRLVAVVGEDFTAKDEAVFRGRKIDLAGLEHAKGKSFFWAGRYSQNMNERTTLATELNVFADFQPDAAGMHMLIRRSFFSAISIPSCSAPCWSRCARSRKWSGSTQ